MRRSDSAEKAAAYQVGMVQLYWLVSGVVFSLIVLLCIFLYLGRVSDRPIDVVINDFQNISTESAEKGFFAAGISDTLSSQLSKIRTFRIFSGKGRDPIVEISGDVEIDDLIVVIYYRIDFYSAKKTSVSGKVQGAFSELLALQDELARQIAIHLTENFDISEK